MTERPGAGETAARAEFMALMAQHEIRPGHAIHVGWLAGRLYDQLAEIHQLAGRCRLWLEAAAHLHDIGHGGNLESVAHHKESARLIREHAWREFAPGEVEIIAQVARYHRRAMPDLEHEEFRRLSEHNRQIVRVLAACLRLADALDRSHERLISEVRAEISPTQITLFVRANRPVIRELQAAEKRSDLARAVFQREIALMLDAAEQPAGSGGPP